MSLSIYFLILFSTTIYAQDYYVMKFNAAGDGKTNDTSAVRAALAAAENSNGGRVIFDVNHTFLTGCFNVTSNIILDIQGTLLAYNNSDGYVPVQPLPW